jgi:hypothetical protein
MNTEKLLKRNNKNELSGYALSCGYIDVKEKDNVRITLWKEGCFHVRKHNHNIGKRIFWESFDTRIEAYKFFKKSVI